MSGKLNLHILRKPSFEKCQKLFIFEALKQLYQLNLEVKGGNVSIGPGGPTKQSSLQLGGPEFLSTTLNVVGMN